MLLIVIAAVLVLIAWLGSNAYEHYSNSETKDVDDHQKWAFTSCARKPGVQDGGYRCSPVCELRHDGIYDTKEACEQDFDKHCFYQNKGKGYCRYTVPNGNMYNPSTDSSVTLDWLNGWNFDNKKKNIWPQ